MTITVRLYRHSDLDLLLLCHAYGKRFARLVSDCLRSYIRNIPPYLAGAPNIEFIENHENIVSSKYIGVSLSSTEDADVLAFLKNNIRYGYRNNFIKNILRLYAGRACIAAYCSTKDGYDYLMRTNTQPVVPPSIIFPTFPGTPQANAFTPAIGIENAPKREPKKRSAPRPVYVKPKNECVSPLRSVSQPETDDPVAPVQTNMQDNMDVFNMFIKATSE